MQSKAGPLADPGGTRSDGSSTWLSAAAASRILFAAAGGGAAVVLGVSWATVTPAVSLALTVAIVVGLVHGGLGWVPQLRIPPRFDPVSYLAYPLVVLLAVFLTPERLGTGRDPVLGIRLGSGVVLAVAAHWALAPRAGQRRGVPGWRQVAVLALLPGILAGVLLAGFGLPVPAAVPAQAGAGSPAGILGSR